MHHSGVASVSIKTINVTTGSIASQLTATEKTTVTNLTLPATPPTTHLSKQKRVVNWFSSVTRFLSK